MKTLSMLKEDNEIVNKLSNKDIKLKKIILENLEFNNLEDLKNIIQINIESLRENGKITLTNLQEYDDKINFTIENSDIISSVLEDTDFFNTTPAELEINNLKLLISKALDTALLNVFNDMLLEL